MAAIGCYMSDIMDNYVNHDGLFYLPIKRSEKRCNEASPKPVVQAFENCVASPRTPATPFSGDLTGRVPIYTLWTRAFGKNTPDAEEGWLSFRKDAIARYNAFENKLKQIESDVDVTGGSDEYLDINYILQKKENIDAIYAQIVEYDVEFHNISKTFEQFAQYVTEDEDRKEVNSMVTNLRERYFNALLQLNRRREILRWTIPRLQRYKSSESEIREWLDLAESRSKSFMVNDIMSQRERIEQIIEELQEKKYTYVDFLTAGKEIFGIRHRIQMDKLQRDIVEVVERWNLLVLNMERCLDRIEIESEKKPAPVEIEKKNRVENIDSRIKLEAQNCSCCTPFKVIKVGDGKYTFGTSKLVRLIRINGKSIVVRVGGGWEYLYKFLLKVDPCRAKQLGSSPTNKSSDAIQLSGISVTPSGKEDSAFTMTIKSPPRSSLIPRKSNSGSCLRTPSDDALGSCDDSLDSLSFSGSFSPSSYVQAPPRSKSTTPTEKGSAKPDLFYCRKVDHVDSKLRKSTGNIFRSVSESPRLSLMERQTIYAQKRNGVVRSTSVLTL